MTRCTWCTHTELPQEPESEDREPITPTDAVHALTKLLDGFPRLARSSASRDRGREPVELKDEYDVQWLLTAVLRMHFEDVRPEECTPSHAGNSSRMDILLKSEQVVLEAKYARAGHAAREITDELLIDIGRNRTHPDCKALVCFVYDPHHVLKNAAELERDLSRDEKVVVRVVVRPK